MWAVVGDPTYSFLGVTENATHLLPLINNIETASVRLFPNYKGNVIDLWAIHWNCRWVIMPSRSKGKKSL